jgi:hypothetical protein
VLEIARRVWVVPVAILIADLTVVAMDHYVASLIARDATCDGERLPLRASNLCRPLVTFTLHGPPSRVRNDVLILRHESTSLLGIADPL